MFTAVPSAPSVVRDESQLAAKPYYVDSLNMRAVNGKMETMYGQETAATSQLIGICRGSFTWADLSRSRWAAFGTHLRLEAMDTDGVLTDITPVIERGQLTNPFTVSSGSATITVTDDAHGLVVDQLVNFPGLSSAAGVNLTSRYPVSSVVSSSSYQFIATSTATISTAGVGGTVDYEYGLRPGNPSNLGGLGYGTGGYGSGGYGVAASSQDLDLRTWSLAQWGQNLIANPNWGAIYEWAPNISASEIVNTGDFSSTGNWVAGSGWTIGGGVASAVNSGSLTQAVTLIRSAWHLLRYDVTRSSGTLTALIGTSTVGTPITTSGTYKAAFFSPVGTSQTLTFAGGNTFSGRIDNVSLKVLTTANIITGSPSSAGSVFVTAERNLVACGTVNASTGSLDPMHLRWSAAENNQDWTASAANVAGSYTLSYGSRIVRGLPGNRENLIFTDTAVYRMRSVPDPSVVYAFDLLGEGCGLIGPNAVTQLNGMFFWVSPQGKFYAYSGGGAVPLNNPSERDFRDNLADVQGGKIYASHLAARNEIVFWYPDERDGIECSRYHVFNYIDQTWVSDSTISYARTSYVDAGIYPFPLSTDSSGNVFHQEKDFSADGAARRTMLETSYFNIGDGETLSRVDGVRPDFDDLRGGVSITFYSKLYPQDQNPRTYGPYSITGMTKRITVRIKGRQIKYRLETNDAPSFYRVGELTFDVAQSGQKK